MKFSRNKTSIPSYLKRTRAHLSKPAYASTIKGATTAVIIVPANAKRKGPSRYYFFPR